MELRIYEGDYLPDGLGGLEQVSGTGELLQRAFLKLTARRGAFPLLPEFGSRLYLLPGVRPALRETAALAWAVEALAGEPELTVTAVELCCPEPDRLLLGVLLQAMEGTEHSLTLEVENG